MSKITGVQDEIKRMLAAVNRLESDAVKTVKAAVFTTISALQEGTPVWSGETVRNYAVSVGGVAAGSTRTPIDNGEPGDTYQGGEGPLGPERRRGVNEQAALADAATALGAYKSLSQKVVVTNLVDDAKWGLIDGGSAPKTPARYPGGVELLGEQRAKARLKDFT